MPFVDPGRIEQSDRVQAASFAPSVNSHHYYALIDVFMLSHLPMYEFTSVSLTSVHLILTKGTRVSENYVLQ